MPNSKRVTIPSLRDSNSQLRREVARLERENRKLKKLLAKEKEKG